MKQLLNSKQLPVLTLLCGSIGLLLRIWLLSTENDRGFIQRGHISAVLLYILTAAFLVILVIDTRPLQQANKFRFNFPASIAGAAGSLAAAVAFGVTSVAELATASDLLCTLTGLTGILAAAALVFAAHCRWKGLHPSTLFHVAICAFLMLRLICMYRQWSADPQLQDYCFQLLAIVCLMLSAYHRATFDANFGQRDSYTLFSLSGVYFCCLSLAGPDSVLFYLGALCWLITDQCNLTPLAKQYREKKTWFFQNM